VKGRAQAQTYLAGLEYGDAVILTWDAYLAEVKACEMLPRSLVGALAARYVDLSSSEDAWRDIQRPQTMRRPRDADQHPTALVPAAAVERFSE
jgi:cystathionine beta-lyase/cystathionine gamma-synthase